MTWPIIAASISNLWMARLANAIILRLFSCPCPLPIAGTAHPSLSWGIIFIKWHPPTPPPTRSQPPTPIPITIYFSHKPPVPPPLFYIKHYTPIHTQPHLTSPPLSLSLSIIFIEWYPQPQPLSTPPQPHSSQSHLFLTFTSGPTVPSLCMIKHPRPPSPHTPTHLLTHSPTHILTHIYSPTHWFLPIPSSSSSSSHHNHHHHHRCCH